MNSHARLSIARFPRPAGNVLRCTAVMFVGAGALAPGPFETAVAQGFPAGAFPAATSEAAGLVPDQLAQPSSPQNPSATPSGTSNAAQQRSIIIVGGGIADGSLASAPAQSPASVPPLQPQSVPSPSQTSPAGTRAPLQWQLGQAQPSQGAPQQQALPPSSVISAPASAAPPPGSLSGAPAAGIARGAYGNAVGTKGRATKSPAVIASSKQTKFTPQRTALLRKEARALEEQNVLARSLRVHKGVAATSTTSIGRPSALLATGAGAPAQSAAVQSWQAVAASESLFAPQPPANSRAALEASALKPQAPAIPRASVRPEAVNKPPGIWFVNNKDSGFVVTPGGYVVIAGKAFGDTVGQVNLFPRSPPERLTFQIVDWHDDEIYALLPESLRGLPDQSAKLQVITRSGTVYLLDNASFRAAREEITLTGNLDRLVRMISTSDWVANPAMSSDGQVVRDQSGDSLNCKAPGTDSLYFRPPAGWEVSGVDYWFGRTDAGDRDIDGNPGDRVFTPGYSVGEWTRAPFTVNRLESIELWMLPVTWGVWRTHRSTDRVWASFGSGMPDECLSNYQIAVSLIGPAGVNPF